MQVKEKTCLHCQEPFIPKRSDAQYCSASCKQLAYLNRKNEEESEEEPIELPLEDDTRVKTSVKTSVKIPVNTNVMTDGRVSVNEKLIPKTIPHPENNKDDLE